MSTPEYTITPRLGLEVLLRAIADLADISLQDETMSWLNGQDEEPPVIPFTQVCDVLGWKETLARKEILRCHKAKEHKELLKRIRKNYRAKLRG